MINMNEIKLIKNELEKKDRLFRIVRIKITSCLS